MKGRVMTATEGAQRSNDMSQLLLAGSVPVGHNVVVNACRLFSDSLEPLVRETLETQLLIYSYSTVP